MDLAREQWSRSNFARFRMTQGPKSFMRGDKRVRLAGPGAPVSHRAAAAAI